MKNLLKSLHKRPINFYPAYRDIVGSLPATIYLSQLMYWFSKKDKIFKTDKEIMKETTLTENELRSAKKILKKLKFLSITREGNPSKTYYEINWEIFVIVMNTGCEKEKTNSLNPQVPYSEINDTNSLNPQVPTCENHETIKINLLTETTTETTTYNPIVPLDILTFYKTNISSKGDKVKEMKSYTAIGLQANKLNEIFIGLKNYKLSLDAEKTDEKYFKSLNNFIEDKVYMDFLQEPKKSNGFEDWK